MRAFTLSFLLHISLLVPVFFSLPSLEKSHPVKQVPLKLRHCIVHSPQKKATLSSRKPSLKKKQSHKSSSSRIQKLREALLTLSEEEELPPPPPENYSQQVARQLQEELELPHKGEVRIRLFISADGGVKTLEILESSDEKNRVFIQEELPLLIFKAPPRSLSQGNKGFECLFTLYHS